MRILGISAYYHDSAAALLVDGRIVAAAQEERFSRRRHDARFPSRAIRFCLAQARLTPDAIDAVAFYEKPFLKFERLIETYLAVAPRGFRNFALALPLWIRERLFQKALIARELEQLGFMPRSYQLLFAEHHQSHAASAFYPSPFHDAVVLTMDGTGEWATTSVSLGEGDRLRLVREIHFPHSLGLLYSAFTYYTGFTVNSGEYKVMGLAPYGTPRFAETIRETLVDIKPDGSFRLNPDYFDYCTGLRMTNERFAALFGQPVRRPEAPLEQFHKDVAASVQVVTNDIVLGLTRALAAEFRVPHLCLAGGVALNCVANGHVLRDGRFTRVWIQPAAGDAGGALGAALAAYHEHHGRPRIVDQPDAMSGSLLGPEFSQRDIEQRLTALGARFDVIDDECALTRTTAMAVADGEAVGWFQGRMEFGPRALGARSILGDPRSPDTQRVLNMKVKYRESFRPFAPSVLAEHVADWFDSIEESPYMLLVADVAAGRRREIPAVTHVDGSARIQTVDAGANRLYFELVRAFAAITGCPMLVNTSFNVRGEPIVCTPEDAFRCFMGTGLDRLVIGRCVLLKTRQEVLQDRSYAESVAPD